VAVGMEESPFTKSPDASTILPNKFEIDYIRIYQRIPDTDTLIECGIRTFPNPTNDKLIIDLNNIDLNSIQHCYLVSSSGQIVMDVNPISEQFEISIKDLINGMYHFVVKQKNNPFPLNSDVMILKK
jgi:hypothetical protein